MKISDDIFDQLRAYVAGDLNSQDALSLEKLIVERPELKSELDFTRKVMVEAEELERKRLLEMVERVMAEDISDVQKQEKRSWSKWLPIIGLIVILSLVIWSFYIEMKGSTAAPTQEQSLILIPIAKTLIQEEYLDNGRVEKNLLKPFNTLSGSEEEILLIKKGLAENRYDETITLIESLSTEHPHVGQLQLIRAYCYLRQSKYDETIAQLTLVRKSNSNIYIKEEAEWLGVITLIMHGSEDEKAQNALRRIAEKENHSFQSEAEKLYK